MLVYVEIVHIYIFKKIFNILFQDKEGPADTKFVTTNLHAVLVSAESTPHSVSQRGVWDRAVIVTFGFTENLIHWLRAVLVSAESVSAQC